MSFWQVTDSASEDGELSPKASPKRKPITFSINVSMKRRRLERLDMHELFFLYVPLQYNENTTFIFVSSQNTFAKPTNGKPQGMGEVKVTSRVDIVGSKKPYGHWMPVKKRGPFSSKK